MSRSARNAATACTRCGHTLATRLMEDGTPVEQIADILGHQSVASTGVYLKSSLGLLAKCALDPDRPAARGVTMTAAITLADAIAALVAGEACRRLQVRRRGAGAGPVRGVQPRRVPRTGHAHRGLGGGVDRRRPATGRQTGDPAGPGRAGQGAGPLAGPAGRAGLPAARGPCCPGRPATSRTSTPTRNWRPCSPRPTDAATAPRFRCGTWSCRCCSARSTPAACAAQRGPPAARRATSTSTPECCRSATRKAARTGRCPSPSRCADRLADYHAQVAGQSGLGLVLPRHQPASR